MKRIEQIDTDQFFEKGFVLIRAIRVWLFRTARVRVAA